MSEATARFALPFILPGQAQKELFHNEALTRLDLLAQAAVEEGPLAVPPATPAIGQCWIVGASATGDWSGREDELAGWTAGGWRFVPAEAGMIVWNKATASGCTGMGRPGARASCRWRAFWWLGSKWSGHGKRQCQVLLAERLLTRKGAPP